MLSAGPISVISVGCGVMRPCTLWVVLLGLVRAKLESRACRNTSLGLHAALSKRCAPQGKGYAGPADMGAIDAREDGCCTTRPLHTVSRKELAMHCYLSDIPFMSPSMTHARRGTISSTAEAFVADLSVCQTRLRACCVCSNLRLHTL
jgi:hypothetical protein